MKKITFVLALVVSSVGFAQSGLTTAKEMGDLNQPTVVYDNPVAPLAPCEFDTPSNNFENGYGPADDPGLIWADDFEVNANESFTINKIGINLLVQTALTADAADIHFYEDTNGAGPGSEITALYDVEATSSTVVGTAFGFDVVRVEFEFDPQEFTGAAGGSTYWMGVVVSYPGTDVYLETTSVTQGNELWVYDEGTGQWIPGSQAFLPDPMDPADLVRTIYGECDVLDVNSNTLSQVSVYPNPTSGILNLKTPSSVEVTSVALYDILGKQVSADYSNDTINMSALSQGVYLLKVETSAGTDRKSVV